MCFDLVDIIIIHYSVAHILLCTSESYNPFIYSVPMKPVSDIVIMIQESDQTVNVSWKPLSYREARGFPFYIVSYTSEDGRFSGSVNTTNSRVAIIIRGLDLQVSYLFTVSVTTGNGSNAGQKADGMNC